MGTWTTLYCSVCKKLVTHRTKDEIQAHEALTNENTEWECWACKTKGRSSITRGKIPLQAYDQNPDDWKKQAMKDLREEAWKDLIKEGFVRKEGDDYIWTAKGNIELQKFWLKWEGALYQKEGLRRPKNPFF